MDRTTAWVTLFMLFLSAGACGDDSGAPDSGVPDSGLTDSGLPDSGLDAPGTDGSNPDGSASDGATDTFVPTDTGPAEPSVLDDLAGGQWMVLSENTLEDVNPCPEGGCPYRGNSGISSVMGAWCGASFATGWGSLGGLIVHGGGHADYYGSEVYIFDVGSRLWQRITDPFDGGTRDCNEEIGSYPDGAPCPSHTYDGVAYDASTNTHIVLNSETNNLGGYTSGYPYMLDLTTLTWSRGSRRMGGSGGTGINSAWDSNRNVMWTLPANGGDFQYFDPSSGDMGEWTSFGRNDIAIDAIASIAPTRDLYAILNTRSADQLEVFDLTEPTADRVTVTTSGAAADVLGYSKPALEWDPIGEQFVVWTEGSSVYTITVPSGDWRTEPWVVSQVEASPENSVDPGAPHSNGTYSRFRYVPSKDVFIVVSNTDAPVYAYRLAR